MSDQLLHAETIRAYLTEVAGELIDRQPQTLIVVGGALLALLDLRGATRDVDTVDRLDDETKAAVERVAARHGMAPRWLNDSSAAFRPQTLDRDQCTTILEPPVWSCSAHLRTRSS